MIVQDRWYDEILQQIPYSQSCVYCQAQPQCQDQADTLYLLCSDESQTILPELWCYLIGNQCPYMAESAMQFKHKHQHTTI